MTIKTAHLVLFVCLSVSSARINNDVEKALDGPEFQRKLQSTSKLSVVGNDGNPATAFPLKKCQGDCDRDSDCSSGLKCYMRDKGNLKPIAGCQGVLMNDRTDYCYDPNDSAPNAPKAPRSPVAPTIKSPTTPNLKTPSSPVVKSPISPTRPTTTARPPIAKGDLKDKGVDWTPPSVYPLGLCEGDCDGDFDCAGELVCHQRTTGMVPSCSGRATANTDYCIHPSDETARPPVPGAFRFKLYWEFGYDWQEEFWEQEWCMECDGNTCEVNDELFLRSCVDDNTWFVYQNISKDVVLLQIAATSLCLEWVDARDIRVRSCNATNGRQQFRALNGIFGGPKFEVSTALREGCLSQHHHPKDGEKIFRANCTRFRTFDTSLWCQY